MRVKNYFTWAVLFLSLIMTECSASKSLTKDESTDAAELRKAIENRAFFVEVDKALPMGGSMRVLTSSYSLTVSGDSVKSHLPFFGRAYNVPYGGGDGLNFESTVTEYQVSFDRKGKASIEFKTKSKEDQLEYRISIFTNGSASIDVTSVNRQPISFSGKAYPKKVEN